MVATRTTEHMNGAEVAYFWASMESFVAKPQKQPIKQIEVTSSEMNIQMKKNIILYVLTCTGNKKKTQQKKPLKK